jgi:hypothetical protein
LVYLSLARTGTFAGIFRTAALWSGTAWFGYGSVSVSAILGVIRDVESAPLENNRSGHHDAAGFVMTFRAVGYSLIFKRLSFVKVMITLGTLIFINWH